MSEVSKDNRNKGKGGDSLSDGATEFILRPGDYDLGSPQSRAAAREAAEAKKKPAEMLRINLVSGDGKEVDELLIEIPPL